MIVNRKVFQNRIQVRGLLWGCIALIGLTGWTVSTTNRLAQAESSATIVVTTTEDNNDPCTEASCSLRAAITLANAGADDDTIELPAGIYTLTLTGAGEDNNTTGDLDILMPLTIVGAGARNTIIDANGIDRIFHLHNINVDSIQIILQDMTIRGGEIDDSGGGILVGSGINARLESVIVENNLSTGGDGGGGLYLQGATNTVIRNSTFAGNQSAIRGGAITANADLMLENSTVSDNLSISGGGIYSNHSTQLRNATITANTGGGVVVALGTSLVTQNSIIAGNTGNDCQGSIDSNGFNLVSNSCPLASSTNSDMTEDDPGLDELALNDGQTPTHALLPHSPAIDAGSDEEPGTTTNACLSHDQRGIERPVDGSGDGTARCDIGAFEYVPDLGPSLFMPLVMQQS